MEGDGSLFAFSYKHTLAITTFEFRLSQLLGTSITPADYEFESLNLCR